MAPRGLMAESPFAIRAGAIEAGLRLPPIDLIDAPSSYFLATPISPGGEWVPGDTVTHTLPPADPPG